MSERALRAATLGCLVLGLALMIPFESTPTRIAGVLALIGFIVCGVFLIASPAQLEDGGGE